MHHLEELEGLDAGTLKQGDEVNLIVGTPISDLIEPIFGPFKEDETIFLGSDELTWPHLLAKLKCFPSASQAAKDRKARKLDLEIEPGYSEVSIGKARKIRIFVWKVIPEDAAVQ